MTPAGFRKLVLMLPGAYESAHHSHPDFRIGKRVLATLAYPDASFAMVRLSPAQQAQFVAQDPAVFVPAKGGWGLRGATNIRLRSATRARVWPALVAGWQNLAPKSARTPIL